MKQKTEISRENLSEQSREQANSTHVKFQGRNQTHATLGWPECSPLSVPTLFQCGCDTAPLLIVVGIMYVKVYFVGLPQGLGFIQCQGFSYLKYNYISPPSLLSCFTQQSLFLLKRRIKLIQKMQVVPFNSNQMVFNLFETLTNCISLSVVQQFFRCLYMRGLMKVNAVSAVRPLLAG